MLASLSTEKSYFDGRKDTKIINTQDTESKLLLLKDAIDW